MEQPSQRQLEHRARADVVLLRLASAVFGIAGGIAAWTGSSLMAIIFGVLTLALFAASIHFKVTADRDFGSGKK